MIDRHNYEAFFLLYIDNELSGNERREVELFVAQNADLADELASLRQVTLAAEDVSFDHKELLYKKEEGISLANYKIYFLLATDKELNAKQQDEVEKFVLQHPQLQGEITLLEQARLRAENIPCPDKARLYKKEKRRIPVAWLRMSAAAALIGTAALGWMYNYASKKEDINTAIVVAPAKSIVVENRTLQPRQPVHGTPVLQTPIALAQPVVKAVNKTKVITTRNTEKEVAKVSIANKRQAVEHKNENVQPVVEERIAATDNTPENEPTQPAIAANILSEKTKGDKPFKSGFVVSKKQPDEQAFVTNAVYRIVDTDEEEKSFYISSAEINKNKLKGLFKKATALFGKKGRKNEDKKPVEIANFQIGG